jgi:hypothetical protein
MIRTLLAITFVAAVAGASGCYAEDTAGPGYGYGYASAGVAPGMVAVGPGVSVIADYDYPVFYSEGAYWRWNSGYWYRSGMYNGGWAVAYNVPMGIRGIDRPYAYAHYRGPGWGGGYRSPAYRGYAGGGYRGGEVRGGAAVRSAPSYRPAGGGYRAPAPSRRR